VKLLAALAFASAVAAGSSTSPGTGAVAAAPSPDGVLLEYRVKAAYLLNFARFVEWPADPADTGPMTICIAGPNPFGEVLNETLRDEQVNGRAIRARAARDDERCHILFVPAGVPPDQYLENAGTQPVLTVGENPDFLRRGGIINFLLEDGKVRFQIDPSNAERGNLRISSRLLRLARVAPETGQTSDARDGGR
jgi:hypothetical protein